MRPLAQMPATVQIDNLRAYPLNIAGFITVPASASDLVINLAAISGQWGEFSLRQMVWNSIAGLKQDSHINIDTALTPAFSWATVDGFQRGVTGVDTAVPRPGLPSYFNDNVRPKIASLAMAVATAYVDVTFSEAIYSMIRGPLTVASFVGRLINNSGGITAIAIATAVKTTGAALVGGETVVRLTLTVTGTPNATDGFGVSLAANAVMNLAGNGAITSEVTVLCKAA
jgi:hypothetical protein